MELSSVKNTESMAEITKFSPFYDPINDGQSLSFAKKILISLTCGLIYIALQYTVMPVKSVFFNQYCWILGVITSTSMMSLYVATELFRRSLLTIDSLQGNSNLSSHVIQRWLSNRRFLLAGLVWGTMNVAVAHLLGIPGAMHSTPSSLAFMYFGYFTSGFASGMGVLAIFAVIGLYLKLAPTLHYALNPEDPDGNGGIKTLGDSLWFFAMLISLVGSLISLYLFNVDWQFMHLAYVRWVFLAWISLPFLIAISIVLIPGLAVRRQVSQYKGYRSEQLKKERASLYAAFKEFKGFEDEAIVTRKKEISERLEEIEAQLENLRKMRSSHIDSVEKTNSN